MKDALQTLCLYYTYLFVNIHREGNTGPAQPTEVLISSNFTSCNSLKIILPMDMNNTGNYILFGFSYYTIQTLVGE